MSTELAVIEDVTPAAPEPLTPLTEGKARALDKRIRQADTRVRTEVCKLLELLEEAAEGDIHKALGYKSWTAWFSEAVQVTPADADQRKKLVAIMSGKGMSQRAIAGSLSVGQATVSRDIEEQGDSDESPDTTTGLDGREYKRKPKDAPKDDEIIDAEVVDVVEEVEEPKAPPISTEFRDEMYNLRNTVSAFGDLLADDRFTPRSRNAIAKKHLNDLQTAIKDLQDVVDALMEND